ncbi:Ivy family c-type lysozyme inhibitor [Mesorhizobium sp. B2-3-4]|uniref:Ivy family c-type lysozyme inhibitor n=1 Tax=Mesorhizobium sp. B2-3-4 TaxID=2589959 RepID=UPI001127B8DB|nr:Ivy family c-type lysozyme inhibitor [Mesorhizobium sp. B2-3-4]TPM37205.1 hypothetical protein FJ967_17130 [Mesorhizobium sp. B2-3-4]
MRRLIIAAALTGMVTGAHANDIYFYDLIKGSAHAQAWKAALGSAKGVPAWLRYENRFIAEPARTVSIEDKTYSISVLAKQHATNDGQAAVMFNADASHAWAEIQEEGKPDLYLGRPSAAQKNALDQALAE